MNSAYLIFPSQWSEIDCRLAVCRLYQVGWFRAGDMLQRTLFGYNWYVRIP